MRGGTRSLIARETDNSLVTDHWVTKAVGCLQAWAATVAQKLEASFDVWEPS